MKNKMPTYGHNKTLNLKWFLSGLFVYGYLTALFINSQAQTANLGKTSSSS